MGGLSAAWGGLTFAAVAGVLAFLISLPFGWDAGSNAWRAAAVVYLFLEVVSVPGWFINRAKGRPEPISELLTAAFFSAVLLKFAFF